MIKRVTVETLTKGFRYYAHLDDGDVVVVRAKATRRYENLFLWDHKANNGASPGLGEYCTMGKNPGTSWGKGPVAIFRIENA